MLLIHKIAYKVTLGEFTSRNVVASECLQHFRQIQQMFVTYCDIFSVFTTIPNKNVPFFFSLTIVSDADEGMRLMMRWAHANWQAKRSDR